MKPTKEQLLAFLHEWASEFVAKQELLSRSDAELFLGASIAEAQGLPPVASLTAHFMHRATEARAKFLGLELSPHLSKLIAARSRSFGEMVMLLAVLRAHGSKHDIGTFSGVLPYGYPNDTELRALWDRQKGFRNGFDADNLLDFIDASLFEDESEGGQG